MDKAYDPNAPEDDMRERAEESERMREHVLKETDKNKDRMISLEEFLTQTKEEDFNKHEDWEGLEEEPAEYTDEEFKQFEVQRNAEIQAMIAQGLVPPGYPYYGDVPPGAIPHPGAVPPPNGLHPQYQPHPGVQGQQVYHPNIQGQPLQGAAPVNSYNPNQHASNVQVGSNIHPNQPMMPNAPLANANQYNPPRDTHKIADNPQVPLGNIQPGGSPTGSQFQQVNQQQQFAGNMQPVRQMQQNAGNMQQNQPPQNIQQFAQNPPPIPQNAPRVQPHGQPQGNIRPQGVHSP